MAQIAPCLTEPDQTSAVWPSGRPIEGKSHGIVGNVGPCCHKVIRRGSRDRPIHVSIGYAKILEMRIPVANGTIKNEEPEKGFQRFSELVGRDKLTHSPEDARPVPAFVLVGSAKRVQDAEIFESNVLIVNEVEAFDYEYPTVLGELELRNLESAWAAALRQKNSFAASSGNSSSFQNFTMCVALWMVGDLRIFGSESLSSFALIMTLG